MKKFTKSLLTLVLLVLAVSGAKAQAETDVTTLPWVQKGQGCTLDFNNENGSTVYGTDAGGSNLSYVIFLLTAPSNSMVRKVREHVCSSIVKSSAIMASSL